MNISLPESLAGFISGRVRSGGYPDADAFVADLVRQEADAMERAARGEPLQFDEHFSRRLEALLDEAAESGDYLEAGSEDFEQMEREALSALRAKGPSQANQY